MIIKDWSSKDNWWLQEGMDFNRIWQSVVLTYADRVAYFKHGIGVSYVDLENEARVYREIFSGERIIRINGKELDWLAQAIAAWTQNQLVVIYDPSWQESDPIRYDLVMSELNEIDWSTNPHLLLFSSGTTGRPKLIVRNTVFALYEAASYIEDIVPSQFEQAICLIKPWFGAITKHCLGMLFAGVPQYFSMSNLNSNYLRTLVYGTPSLITYQTSKLTYRLQALSLTGERVNAFHVETFKQYLDFDGFILDAYGSTECGVIARQKFNYNLLDKMLGVGFSGEILPGKDITIDANGLLSISAWRGTSISTGDLARIEGGRLTLIGRLSSKRKIRGVWVDVSPLLHLLSTHPEIYHFELSTKQTGVDQLIVLIAAKPTLSEEDLYQWIFENLVSFQLMPLIVLSYCPPDLGVTGKQILLDKCLDDKIKGPDYVLMLLKSLLSCSPKGCFLDMSLEELGLDSIDMARLILELEYELNPVFPVRTILKTDTPRTIAQLLFHEPKQGLFRLLNDGQTTSKQVICFGPGMLGIRQELSKFSALVYSDIINEQKSPFSFTELANLIFERESKFFIGTKPLYLVGYSINAILVVELAYQLEKRGILIEGVFLLDPPDSKRKSYLRKKRLFLELRANLFRLAIGLGKSKWKKRYYYELRKLAISKQPLRSLKAKSLTLYSSGFLGQHPWLKKLNQHRSLELHFSGHIELVSTYEGIECWKALACDFLNQS